MPKTYEIYNPNEKPRWPEAQQIQIIDNQLVATYRDSNDALVVGCFLRSYNFIKKEFFQKEFFQQENTIIFNINLYLSVENIQMFIDPYWNRIIPIRTLFFPSDERAKNGCRWLKRNFERDLASMVVFSQEEQVVLGFPKNFYHVSDEIFLRIKEKTTVLGESYSFVIVDSRVMIDFENRVNKKQNEDEIVMVESGFCELRREDILNCFNEEQKIILGKKNIEENYFYNNSFLFKQVRDLIYEGSKVFLPMDFEELPLEDLSQKKIKI